MILVGAAFQLGAIPLSAESIEHAITLNGASVEKNIQAFRRGRQAIADPVSLEHHLLPAALTGPHAPGSDFPNAIGAEPDSELARLVGRRAADLDTYQDSAYAARYVDFVERVRVAESAAVFGTAALAEAVARNLYKLMAYKDEYEVARLALDPSTTDMLIARFGPDVRAAWKLHPPVLRALGLKKKITLGPWFTPVFRILRALRRLRGTPFDVFGYAHVRRVERELVTEYESVITCLLLTLGPSNHPRAVEIAELPDEVRGYEQIKLDAVNRYRSRLTALLAESPASAPKQTDQRN
jgi:indolepyruvate ferredoxin oxidoreductase